MSPRVVVVLPALNAARTLERTVRGIPSGAADHLILVDDGSTDGTPELARALGLEVHVHPENRGYGANQKTCYRAALAAGADIVVLLHPDLQYDPALVPELVRPLAEGRAEVVLASRFLRGRPLQGGMPLYKYVANRALTGVENRLLGQRLSEYHTGYRAFTRAVLERLPLDGNRDDFVFDNQILAQAVAAGFRIAEVPCPTRYADDSSSIDLRNSLIYGVGVLETALRFRLHRLGWLRSERFDG